MNKITRIKIDGFRRLRTIDFMMKPFIVLIGANGVGKTSFLDVFSILSSSASGQLNKTLSQFGGLVNILTRGKAENLSFVVDMDVPGYDPLKYSIQLATKGPGYAIVKEILEQQRQPTTLETPFRHIDSSDGDIRYFSIDENKIVRPNWEYNPMETSLSQVPKMYVQPEELRRIFATATQYHVLDVGPRAPVKLPQLMKPAILPGEDGSELVPYLYYMRETDRDNFEMIVDSLHAAFPNFEELSFPPVATGMLMMTWKDRNFSKPLYMQELSEGTLRFLWLVSLLQSRNLSTVTMIDEPEVSLHPELLSILANLMREASKRTQIIVATHSDRFVRFLKPEEVMVMDMDEDGCTTAIWADSMDLEEWLAEYTLDEVWQMGQMGGRS
jgi:predicted ATPase